MLGPLAMTDRQSPTPGILNRADGFRRIRHLVIAAAAWGLFLRWWWVVLRDVSPRLVATTLLFLLITVIASVALTGFWVIHNMRIARSHHRRRAPRSVRVDWTRDRLGRLIVLPTPAAESQRARLLGVRLNYDRKMYVVEAVPSADRA